MNTLVVLVVLSCLTFEKWPHTYHIHNIIIFSQFLYIYMFFNDYSIFNLYTYFHSQFFLFISNIKEKHQLNRLNIYYICFYFLVAIILHNYLEGLIYETKQKHNFSCKEKGKSPGVGTNANVSKSSRLVRCTKEGCGEFVVITNFTKGQEKFNGFNFCGA